MTRQVLDLPKGLGAVVFTAQARGLAVKVFPDGTVPDVGSDKFPRVVLIRRRLKLPLPKRQPWASHQAQGS
jgi:hypothetical protein